jgi:F0F1-type ATP synthase beta subunit
MPSGCSGILNDEFYDNSERSFNMIEKIEEAEKKEHDRESRISDPQ